MTSRFHVTATVTVAVVLALLTLGVNASPAADGGAAGADCNVPSPFTIGLRALTDANGTELAATVTPRPAACDFPETLKNVQVKTYALDGELASTRIVKAVAAPHGHAMLDLPPLRRTQRLEVLALVQTEDTVRTVVLRAATPVRLRPDLAVTTFDVPEAGTVSATPFAVRADVDELNGDVGLSADAVLRRTDSGEELGRMPLDVTPGGTASLSFPLTLAGSGPVPLRLDVVDASVAEVTTNNNTRRAVVELLQFARGETSLVDSLSGYGGQFNQHVYAKLSMPPVDEQNVLDMEQKMVALQPNLARIYINGSAFQAATADRLVSFYRTADLAKRAGAEIIVNWQGGIFTATTMQRFSDVVVDLLTNRGHETLWISLFNEPNTTSGITQAVYESSWRTFDARMRAAGVRDRLHYMGAELTLDKQASWLEFLSSDMADVLDAWSIHVFWDYWDTPKITSRLAGVRAIWDATPAEARRPLYVTEYGVRGLKTCGGVAQVDPGSWSDCTPMTQTVLNGWQHAWLSLQSSRLGYVGALKWDSYWGKYDSGTQAYYMIGSPLAGWPIYPVYWTTRLLTLTTRPGWTVVDGMVDPDHKLVTAYAGGPGELTVVGMDTGDPGFALADDVLDYAVGGLPESTSFRLITWNGANVGALADEGVVRTDAAGVAHLTAHRHAVWALTTLEGGI